MFLFGARIFCFLVYLQSFIDIIAPRCYIPFNLASKKGIELYIYPDERKKSDIYKNI